MLWLSLILVLLLIVVHAGADDTLVAQPISMFRENVDPFLGYGIFALLLAIAGLALYTSARARR
ncbi:hypothetical protein HRbin36_00123 [bacterium HR36]|nr:hypothetical protein HRbin36_00123 [bacterium HR36]